MKFAPDDITLKKGDTVLWVNQDMMGICPDGAGQAGCALKIIWLLLDNHH